MKLASRTRQIIKGLWANLQDRKANRRSDQNWKSSGLCTMNPAQLYLGRAHNGLLQYLYAMVTASA